MGDGTTGDQPPPGTSPADAEKFYRSARYVYDVPASVTAALKNAEETAQIELDDLHDLTGEDVLYAYNNGPRTLRSSRILVLQLFRVLDPRQATPDIKDPMGKYAMMWASAHFALDGLATFVLLNEFFELLGGARDPALAKSASSSDVMSAKDLATLLESELKARREHASKGAIPDGVASRSSTSWSSHATNNVLPFQEAIPPSLDERVTPFKTGEDKKQARLDFDKDEKKFIVSIPLCNRSRYQRLIYPPLARARTPSHADQGLPIRRRGTNSNTIFSAPQTSPPGTIYRDTSSTLRQCSPKCSKHPRNTA